MATSTRAPEELDQSLLLEVLHAYQQGDFSARMPRDLTGVAGKIADVLNDAIETSQRIQNELERVGRVVGKEGKIGHKCSTAGLTGGWLAKVDAVNSLIDDLTAPTNEMARVITAVATGDLSQHMSTDVDGRPLQGQFLRTAKTVNTMVDQLNSFAGEVNRVAGEVGTEGKLGGQARVRGVSGVWRELTDNVNQMAANLTSQVRNIAEVTTAVANGDLSKKITVEGRGEILELKNTINVMVDQLNGFASEVTRVAREVGTEGKLGGQAEVPGVGGVWKDLTDNVNLLAGQLTNQIRNIADVTTAVANGDLSKKVTVDVKGEILELKNTINRMVDQLNSFAGEVTRVAREVGTEGKLGGQADVRGVGGVWKDLTDSVNLLAGQLTNQIRNIADVTTAVATGDLSKKVTVDVQGEILELKNTLNTMVDQLNSFASEVTRVAREVGTEGKLGGQAQVPGVAGTWKDLTDNVNLMAGNLTSQVRGVARVVTAVAQGDLNRKLTVEAKGEIADLAETINEMTDTLATFADQVTSVAREVGVEGKLGGQASVPGAAGTWKDLVDNVNQLAAQLTNQIRAMADVATAVLEGDLTRSVNVEASGEVAVLKDKVNEMIVNLRETTQRNAEQDWLKTNLARFTRLLQGQRDLTTVARMILSDLAPLVGAQHGVFYTAQAVPGNDLVLKLHASYAYRERKNLATSFRLGEGLVGQCALEKQRILVTNAPGDYVQVSSGLGEAPPLSIVVLPVLFEGEVKAVIELASFDRFSAIHQDFLDQLTESIGIVLNTIEANMRTEQLLVQSQTLAQELQSRQEELQTTNAELEEKARMLAEQNVEVERKNREVELARASLEEKAEQLEVTSKYKSEFLANMSHELRTPLNSLLILAEQLSENGDGNLTEKQVEFAKIIRSSGQDLLSLINEILDLSKIESGTVVLDFSDVAIADLREFAELNFRHLASNKGLTYDSIVEPDTPATIHSDPKRVQQILRNLLSNAIKFTEEGRVELSIAAADGGWSRDRKSLNEAEKVIAFRVADTGIGIPADKQRQIFEAFQQADGTTSRKYGGTGLGLSISRELVQLLGGEIKLESEPGVGSTFTVYLPLVAPAVPQDDGHDRDGHARDGRDGANRSRPTTVATAVSEALALQPERPMPVAEPVREVAIRDDRGSVNAADRLVLIVEDDGNFANVLLEIAHSNQFKGLIAQSAAEAMDLARRFRPDAVTLDIGLQGQDGWAFYDQLIHDPDTAGIPVHIVSVREEDQIRGAKEGLTFLTKPVTRDVLGDLFTRIRGRRAKGKSLLVVEDDTVQRQEIVTQFSGPGLEILAVGSGEDALRSLRRRTFDCIVLDLGLPDMTGFEFIERVQSDPVAATVPIVVYTAMDLSRRNASRLKKTTRSVVAKSGDEGAANLHEQVDGFLRQIAAPAEPAPPVPAPPTAASGVLAGRRVLVVDDDIRNIYALTALLERHDAAVIAAESGAEAIELLRSSAAVDAVLMDVMMPGMDGLTTIRAIRKQPEFDGLPIVALTAKAMQGDREMCLEAGATDYVAKPVDGKLLISVLQRWIAGGVEV